MEYLGNSIEDFRPQEQNNTRIEIAENENY